MLEARRRKRPPEFLRHAATEGMIVFRVGSPCKTCFTWNKDAERSTSPCAARPLNPCSRWAPRACRQAFRSRLLGRDMRTGRTIQAPGDPALVQNGRRGVSRVAGPPRGFILSGLSVSLSARTVLGGGFERFFDEADTALDTLSQRAFDLLQALAHGEKFVGEVQRVEHGYARGIHLTRGLRDRAHLFVN